MIGFEKWHGCGNDFVLIDAIGHPELKEIEPTISVEMCRRSFGIGADGVLLVYRNSDRSLGMRMINPDGSVGGMCGNGLRCAMLFAHRHGYAAGSANFETPTRCVQTEMVGTAVRVDMGRYSVRREDLGMIPGGPDPFIEASFELGGKTTVGTAVSMGNPHLIIFRDPDPSLDVEGPIYENCPLFTDRANVHFATAEGSSRVSITTWERGAGATLACGSGACAVAVAGLLTGRTEARVTIAAPGGELEIEVTEPGNVWMTGPATHVFDGFWPK